MAEALIWTVIVFVLGSVLILERRCLGQMAIVQPLVVCLIAGLISGEAKASIWLGITLQLFSRADSRQVDWAFCGITAAAGFAWASRMEIPLIPGGPEIIALIIFSIIAGIAAKAVELRYARTDGESLRLRSPWSGDDVGREIEKLVRSVSLRWLAIAGIQVAVAVGIIVLAMTALHYYLGESPTPSAYIVSAIVPSFGIASALSSMSQYRFLSIAGAAAIISWVVIA